MVRGGARDDARGPVPPAHPGVPAGLDRGGRRGRLGDPRARAPAAPLRAEPEAGPAATAPPPAPLGAEPDAGPGAPAPAARPAPAPVGAGRQRPPARGRAAHPLGPP